MPNCASRNSHTADLLPTPINSARASSPSISHLLQIPRRIVDEILVIFVFFARTLAHIGQLDEIVVVLLGRTHRRGSTTARTIRAHVHHVATTICPNSRKVAWRPARTDLTPRQGKSVGAQKGGTARTQAQARCAAVQCHQTIAYGRESDRLPTQPARARRQPAPPRLPALIHLAQLIPLHPQLVVPSTIATANRRAHRSEQVAKF